LLTGRPAVIERIWQYLGVWYQRVGEERPPGTDWLTGRPLSYDVDHEDALLYLDASGRVRFVVVGTPNAPAGPPASQPCPSRSSLHDPAGRRSSRPDTCGVRDRRRRPYPLPAWPVITRKPRQ